ncbi:MAG: electron transfer flavoprotein subunit beta/FixA family protein [Candidatus Omnitrophica bacterium]|nr:electron transfer flavoprotein subunit beta/FixA family protein [Candidatus Omnitrophota bacterium]MCM8806664.1 electron transfer flavoprotein subunit beta/FixA family protein [Candidatus Omnitrophota bacterium]
MKIIVCIKQVPEGLDVKVDPETKRIVREGVKSIINPYDLYAIEEGIRLKERFGGETWVISMGPLQAESAIREAIGMGIDYGVLLSDKKFAGSDTLATSYTLSLGIKKIGNFDIIICGRETLDGSTGQVGPGIAEHLGIPYISYVSKIIDIKDGIIECKRLMEDHYEIVKTKIPVLITVIKEINEPRIPSLKNMLRAKKIDIPIWNAESLQGNETFFGQDGSPTRVIDVWTHTIKKEGRKIEGDPEKLADEIISELKKIGVV